MKKTLAVFCTLWLLFFFTACNKKACERSCDCLEGYDAEADVRTECVENCLDYLDEAKDNCQDAFRDYARCQDRYNCEADNCGADYKVYADKCEMVNMRGQLNDQGNQND